MSNHFSNALSNLYLRNMLCEMWKIFKFFFIEVRLASMMRALFASRFGSLCASRFLKLRYQHNVNFWVFHNDAWVCTKIVLMKPLRMLQFVWEDLKKVLVEKWWELLANPMMNAIRQSLSMFVEKHPTSCQLVIMCTFWLPSDYPKYLRVF